MTSQHSTPLSVLDLAVVRGGSTVREALEASVAMAQCAERTGYTRVWYAEHHNMASIASSATSVLIAHVAAHTRSIRLGSGGVMLPNHSPLTIAEQFGTLATLHPDRIDLGLGRAPGTDQPTMRALRRDPMSAESFPEDVLELQGFLGDDSRVPGVRAIPGAGTKVPLYILGSSTFGAQLAAHLGLPYGFASHFAPEALTQAVDVYRRGFQPSEQATEPWVIAGVNVIVAPTEREAADELNHATRSRVAALLAPGRKLSDAELDSVMSSPGGRQVASMMRYTASGTPDTVKTYLDDFQQHANADELIVVPASRSVENRLQSLELLAQVSRLG
ncbi:LLM class flavin-dependent oxidoreductase [Candidatus Microthrix parvicella]|uniref:LLM class flavin-dependent oxidoreductase n=1 Tax=Candidatus Neomicrothrix parvicella TaxID=41950 RepID=UPI00035E3AD4|nr:LLM class flavin-dependent oxidoreductase [Candidatus Microthrix parvicella]